MDVKEKAMIFAIKAFGDKVRKAEPEKNSVLHSIDVANKIKKYGFDDNVIAAGYLHDVVEDTNYTIEDIEKEFGKDIASLVKGATEENRSLSWEERKLNTIKRIKNLDLRHKAVIACDKLSNTEDLLYLFGRKGREDYSSFKRGKDKKIWYWKESYKSLIHNEDKNMKMFRDLKDNIDNILYQKEINKEPTNIIKYKKLELDKLYNIIKINNSYNIFIIDNDEKYLKRIKKEINQITNDKPLYIEDDIINKLIELNTLYLNNKLPTNKYLEKLDKYLNYIWENIDKIIYIDTYNNNNESLYSVLKLLKNNNINIEILKINDDNYKNEINRLCNNILKEVRENRLNDIKRLIRKKQAR